MEIMEIIGDALKYPLNNIKSLIIYVILGIIAFLVLALTGAGILVGASVNNFVAGGIIGIFGSIVFLLIYLLIDGYGLDVIKLGIDRVDESPSIDFVRQITNGIKLCIVVIVYLLIPFIVMLLLGYINNMLGVIVGFILLIVFLFALIMAECRLANTGSLGEALNVSEACKDIMRVGIGKILAVIILLFIITFILSLIASIFAGFGDIGSYISAILNGIVTVYTTFVMFRATGLLYSNAI